MKHLLRPAALCAVLVAAFISAPAAAPSPDIVISQVYGGGGNSGATYTHDFIELFNRGTSAINLGGWSVQYASASGTTWQVTPISGILQPGQYYLVQQAKGAGGTTPLPAPDATGGIAMAATNGKVALASTLTPLAGACPAGVWDFVGFGSANCSETLATPTLSNTTAAIRLEGGCTDTDNNKDDFSIGAPAPRNSASPLAPCSSATPELTIGDVSVFEGNSGTTTVEVIASLSMPATSTVTFIVETADGSATTSDGDYVALLPQSMQMAAGEQERRVTLSILGDSKYELAETFFVRVSALAGADAKDLEAAVTILNDDDPPVRTIHDIQGAGAETPFAGQEVITTGIVTATKSNGFFLQTPDADADADEQTSQGIFVFTSTAPGVVSGTAVRVRGTAVEYFGLTEITTTAGNVQVLSTGNPLPAPVVLTGAILDPAGAPAQMERFEGMLLAAASLVAVGPTNAFGEISTVLPGVARPMREPGLPVTTPVPPDPSGGIDCCIPRWDLNPERILLDTDALPGSTRLLVTSAVTITDVGGPLDFSFGEYKIAVQTATAASPNMTAVPVPAPAAGELTIAGFNIENFRSTNATQLQKAALAIADVMRYPDVIGHVEIRDLVSLEALAAAVNQQALARGLPDPQYEAHLLPTRSSTQNVGFLVKRSRVGVTAVVQERASETFVDPRDGSLDPVHDRAPLVLHATFGPDATPIKVVVNHPRSFIDSELSTSTGLWVRAKRRAQAESLASLLNELQTGYPGTPVVSLGDYNAYEFNDGLNDPIAIVKGQPTPDEQIVEDDSPDLVTPDFINLTGELPAAERYSFVFEGTPQALDHVLVNTVARSYLTRYAIARANADFPDDESLSGDATRPERASDHDMPVAYFDFDAPAIQGLRATPDSLGPPNHKMVDVTLAYSVLDASPVTCVPSVASSEPADALGDGHTTFDWQVLGPNHVQLRAERSGTGRGRIYTITLTCTDAAGRSSSAATTVTVAK